MAADGCQVQKPKSCPGLPTDANTCHLIRVLDHGAHLLWRYPLKFHIWVNPNICCNTDPADWGKLDNILSKSGAFPFLRNIEIVVLRDYCAMHNALEEDFLDIGTNHFPSLRDRDGLTFPFEIRKALSSIRELKINYTALKAYAGTPH